MLSEAGPLHRQVEVARPVGPFALRICAGCGQQLNDGHHAHDGRLSPVYDVPAVLESALDDLVHIDHAYTAQQEAAYLRDVLTKIADRRPNREATDAAFHRSRREAREALKVTR